MPRAPHNPAARYFALQAAAVAAWWLWLLLAPWARAWFVPAGTPDYVLLAFALPDAVVLTAGSALTAVALAQRAPWANAAAFGVTAAAAYAALWCIAAAVMTGEAIAAAVAMTAMTLASTAALRVGWR